jgi:hypothetical protein
MELEEVLPMPVVITELVAVPASNTAPPPSGQTQPTPGA